MALMVGYAFAVVGGMFVFFVLVEILSETVYSVLSEPMYKDESFAWVGVVGALVAAYGVGIVIYEYAPTKSRLSVGAVIVVVVVGLSLIATAIVLKPSVDLRPVLSLDYDNGGISGDSRVNVVGQIYNDGNVAGYGSLLLTIQDGRGWSITAMANNLGPIEGGGFVDVDLSYDWPQQYGGVYVDHPVQIVPTWTYDLSASGHISNV